MCINTVCLDGTLPGYHLHRGHGSGANSWLIQLEVSKLNILFVHLDKLLSFFSFKKFDVCVLEIENVWKKGGGWCDNIRNCVYRKKSRRGSSNYMEKQIQFTGILSDKAQQNPGLFLFFFCLQ